MKLLDDLVSEHVLIERTVLGLVTYADRRASGEASAADARAFLRFFRSYAGRYHHAREEQVLFPALVAAEVPGDRGPIPVITKDHRQMEGLLEELAPLLEKGAPDAAERGALTALVRRYAESLLHHIDAENSVLIPESAIRFRGAAVTELDDPPPTADELAARAEGERLCAIYPADPMPQVFRGDGCVACPSYGHDCEGLERTWWSELEWEDARDRLGSG